MIVSDVIIEKCKSNDRMAQRRVFEALLPAIKSVVRRYLLDLSFLDDMLQEVFIKIFQNIQLYDPAKGTILNWTTRLAINHVINFNHKNLKKAFEELPEDMTSSDSIRQPVVYSNLGNDELLQYLKRMPAISYEVLNLHAIQGYQHSEIAEILEISEANSRKILSRARKWIKANGIGEYDNAQSNFKYL